MIRRENRVALTETKKKGERPSLRVPASCARSLPSLRARAIYPDPKIEWGLLNMAAYAREVGIEPWADAFVVLGAFTHNPVEWAIVSLGGTLALLAYSDAHMTHTDAIDKNGWFSAPACLQGDSLRDIALARNVHLPVGGLCFATAGAGTRIAFLENAAMALLYTATGCGFVWGAASGNGVTMNDASGLVGKLVAEVSAAAAGVPKDEADRILDKILAEYESPTPAGKTFPELYDVERIEPKPEHLEDYLKVKQELREFGIPFKY